MILPALCVLAFLGFTALGLWQVERRRWKLDLIARVEAHLAAPPIALEDQRDWPALGGAAAEYRRVTARGTWRHDQETLVDALTERGAGFWVLTPLDSPAGTILVNRGFVPRDRRDPRTRPAGQVAGPVQVEGLVRRSEPGGRVLRPNVPAEQLFYSRDVAAIAAARGIATVAPFFIDAGPRPNPGGLPIGGLTVVRFRNTHALYAATWFALAALALGGLVLLVRRGQDAR